MSDNLLCIQARRRFDDFTLSVDQAISARGVTAIFGPSGCGKTTFLNLIAGFDRPDSGRITFRGQSWVDTEQKRFVPAHERGAGFLFQDSRLFAHLDVRQNLAFADKRSRNKGRYTVEDITTAADLEPLLDRRPYQLSGGERQRAALARTLLSRPNLLLFDEPLSALDRGRKAELLPFLKALPQRFDIPVLYVSHDVDEVSAIADSVCIMENGRLTDIGPAAKILPAYGLTAGRNPYENASTLIGRIADRAIDHDMMAISIGAEQFWMPAIASAAAGSEVTITIPARDVAIAQSRPNNMSIQNILPVTITAITRTGSGFCDLKLDVDGQNLSARITERARSALALSLGDHVFALIKSAGFQR